MRVHSILFGVAIAFHATARAQLDNITPGELALMPPYCQDVQTMNGWSKTKPSPRTGYWIGVMGESFWTMHHHCWGLIRTRRAMAAGVSPMVRESQLKHSVADYEFVVINSSKDFVLLPEVLTRLGETHLMLGNPGAAYDAFTKARSLKPDYWPPYQRWAEVLIKTNQKAEAKKLVEQGLRHSPNAKPLQEQYRLLGGNPHDIQPVAAEKASEAASTPGR
jgi:hypothetical protein